MRQREARLQKRIVAALGRAGIPAWRIRPMGLSGWPDIYGILPGGRALHIEVKMPKEEPEPLQADTLKILGEAGAVVGWTTSVKEALAIAGVSP